MLQTKSTLGGNPPPRGTPAPGKEIATVVFYPGAALYVTARGPDRDPIDGHLMTAFHEFHSRWPRTNRSCGVLCVHFSHEVVQFVSLLFEGGGLESTAADTQTVLELERERGFAPLCAVQILPNGSPRFETVPLPRPTDRLVLLTAELLPLINWEEVQ